MIRAALASDITQIASLHVRAWQAAYRGHMPDHFLDSLEPAARAEMWARALRNDDCLVLIAEAASGLLGFCCLIPSRDLDADVATAELSSIYVDPNCVRSGVGSLLLEHAVAAARARAFRRLSLWVLHNNAPALAFYRARSFLPDGTVKTQAISTFQVQEVRLRRSLLAC